MLYENGCVKELKLAYIGGGSRGWAWTLMNDLKKATDLAGTVYLYDIDFKAAKDNEVIGNKIDGAAWKYKAVETAKEAMTDADFVIVSILPGTFDEMQVDVHAPEKYGVYQSVPHIRHDPEGGGLPPPRHGVRRGEVRVGGVLHLHGG